MAEFSFEGYKRFYPNCPVVSGYGTPIVWCRLPDNTTRRCFANSDIRYGKVFVAIGANNQAFAFSPHEGRQLQQRIEQFLKVRSASQEEALQGTEHSFFPFFTMSFDSFIETDAEGGVRAIYSNEFKIWGKIDNQIPVEIDAIAFNGGTTITYGNTLNISVGGDNPAGFLGRFETQAGLENFAYRLWHNQITSNVVAIFSVQFIVSDNGDSQFRSPLLFVTLYEISEDPEVDGEVIYREVSYFRTTSNIFVTEPVFSEGDDVTGLLGRADADEYANFLPPRFTGNFTSGDYKTPVVLPGHYYSMPENTFSIVTQITDEDLSLGWDITFFNKPASNDVQRPPFCVPVNEITNWQRKTRERFDPVTSDFIYEYDDFNFGYSWLDVGRFIGSSVGNNYYKPTLLPAMPDGYSSWVQVDADGIGTNVVAETLGLQYAYQFKAWWTLTDEKPLLTLSDEQHTAYENGEDFDPYIIPNPPLDCDIDIGEAGRVIRLSPRGFCGYPILSGVREDRHLMYYLLNNDRLFHIYTRESNTDPPSKIEEFEFSVTLDDLRTMGAADTCYVCNAAQINTSAPLNDVLIAERSPNFAFNLNTAFSEPETSRLSICHGSLSWRNSETPLFESTIDEDVTRQFYRYTVCAFGMYPTFV